MMDTIASTNSNFKKWLLDHDHKNSESEEENNLPRILLLDGGVSTYIEKSLEMQRLKNKSVDSLSTSLSQTRSLEDECPNIVTNPTNSDYNFHSCPQHCPEFHKPALTDHVFSHRELWSSSLLLTAFGRNAIQTCHSQFYDAGSDIISSVTYQCHYLICDCKRKNNCHVHLESGISEDDDYDETHDYYRIEDIDKMLRDGMRLARQSSRLCSKLSSSSRFVAASIGCYGGALADGSEYTGNYGVSIEELIQFHKRKSIILAKERPDVLAYETIPCSVECRAIIHVLKNELPDDSPPAWLSLACSDDMHLNDGTLVIDALLAIDECDQDDDTQHVAGIGINCCSGDHILSLLKIVVKHMATHNKAKKRAILFYPNSGEEWDAIKQDWKQGTGCSSPEAFADIIMNGIVAVHQIWKECHGDIIDLSNPPPKMIVGGCCRTTPDAISAIKKRLRSI